ncbi:MAG: hypothetical protein ACOY94_28070 [Bacillota bacterium]
MSKQEQGWKTGGVLFWRGLIAGLAVAAVVLALAAGVVTRRGVVVTVETAVISRRMGEEVRQAVRRELPAALGQVRAELPRQVSSEAGRRLATMRIDLAGFEVPIPPSAVQQVEQALEGAVRAGLDTAIRQVDVDGLAGALSLRAGRIADAELKGFLARQAITVELLPGLQIPVRLIPR